MNESVKKLSLITLVLFVAVAAFSQDRREEKQQRKEAKRQKINELMRQAEEGVLVYHKQSVFGIQLRTNGYGAFYEYGKMKTNRKTNLYRIDFAEIKEAKEEKYSQSSPFGFSSPFIFGKRNYFYPVTIGFGQQYILGQKGNKNGVAVTGVYYAGVALGLLRPYYLTINDPSRGQRDIKYDGADTALFVDPSVIEQGAGFSKGWGEIKVKPGAFGKLGMRFDWGRFNESVSALEVGLSADYYPGKIPIMVYQKERQLFVQAYVSFLFGRRK